MGKMTNDRDCEHCIYHDWECEYRNRNDINRIAALIEACEDVLSRVDDERMKEVSKITAYEHIAKVWKGEHEE